MVPQHRNAGPRFERDVRLRVNACRKRLRRIKFEGSGTDHSRDAEFSAAPTRLAFASGDGDTETETAPEKKSDTTA